MKNKRNMLFLIIALGVLLIFVFIMAALEKSDKNEDESNAPSVSEYSQSEEVKDDSQPSESTDKSNTVIETPSSQTLVDNTEDLILTVDNNEDLAAVLSTKNELDPIIKDFAEEYSLRTIEFDGYISNVTQYEDYKTRLNVLVYAGDYRTDNLYGPNIQLKNVGTTDYNWVETSVNKNVHIVAKIMEYQETSGLLILTPESIDLR